MHKWINVLKVSLEEVGHNFILVFVDFVSIKIFVVSDQVLAILGHSIVSVDTQSGATESLEVVLVCEWEVSAELRHALRHAQLAVGLDKVCVDLDAIGIVLETMLKHVYQDEVDWIQDAPVVNFDLPKVLDRDHQAVFGVLDINIGEHRGLCVAEDLGLVRMILADSSHAGDARMHLHRSQEGDEDLVDIG